MATIPIKPVPITTDGGMQGEITGIDPSREDCLVGTISNNKQKIDVVWNKSGICRDNHPDLNIHPQNPDEKDVIDTVNAIQNP